MNRAPGVNLEELEEATLLWGNAAKLPSVDTIVTQGSEEISSEYSLYAVR